MRLRRAVRLLLAGKPPTELKPASPALLGHLVAVAHCDLEGHDDELVRQTDGSVIPGPPTHRYMARLVACRRCGRRTMKWSIEPVTT